VLHLSGPRLREALEALACGAEASGGIEQLVAAAQAKAELFQHLLGGGRAARLARADFEQLTAFAATVRRRNPRALDELGWPRVREHVAVLLEGAGDAATADQRMQVFIRAFPSGREWRFVRDLAAELLHNVHPEHYPLMHRWVWDARANTGALREMWHGESGQEPDRMTLDVGDGYDTFLVLREELAGFLTDNGVFRDVLWYVDLLTAQVYARYIDEQAGAYLKPDFVTAASDPLEQARRLLGLDGKMRDVVRPPNRRIGE
jgi:hypothetical protein